MFQTNAVEKIKIHTSCPVNSFSENHAVYEIIWEHIVEPDRKHDSMAHAHCMLDNYGYKHTLTICNIHCFSTATKFIQRGHNATSISPALSPKIAIQTWRNMKIARLPVTVTSSQGILQ
jgi:hypothetical protein